MCRPTTCIHVHIGLVLQPCSERVPIDREATGLWTTCTCMQSAEKQSGTGGQLQQGVEGRAAQPSEERTRWDCYNWGLSSTATALQCPFAMNAARLMAWCLASTRAGGWERCLAPPLPTSAAAENTGGRASCRGKCKQAAQIPEAAHTRARHQDIRPHTTPLLRLPALMSHIL